MSLYDSIDPVAVASHGVYTETYGSTAPANIANLYASRGYLEDAPNVFIKLINIMMSYVRRRNSGN
jgi:hypothetical protein